MALGNNQLAREETASKSEHRYRNWRVSPKDTSRSYWRRVPHGCCFFLNKVEMAGFWSTRACTTFFFTFSFQNVTSNILKALLPPLVGVSGLERLKLEKWRTAKTTTWDACSKFVGWTETAAWEALLEMENSTVKQGKKRKVVCRQLWTYHQLLTLSNWWSLDSGPLCLDSCVLFGYFGHQRRRRYKDTVSERTTKFCDVCTGIRIKAHI